MLSLDVQCHSVSYKRADFLEMYDTKLSTKNRILVFSLIRTTLSTQIPACYITAARTALLCVIAETSTGEWLTHNRPQTSSVPKANRLISQVVTRQRRTRRRSTSELQPCSIKHHQRLPQMLSIDWHIDWLDQSDLILKAFIKRRCASPRLAAE